jgi:hypothetical protein
MMGRNGQQQRAMNKTDVISTTSSAAQSSPSSSSSSSLVMASSPISSAIPSASFYCKNTIHPSLSAPSSKGSSMSSTSVPLSSSSSSAVPTSATALSIGQHQQLAASFLLAQQQQRTTSHPHCPPANSPTAANKLLSPSSTSFAADAFPISLPAAPSPFASPFASRIHFNQQQQQLIAAAFPNLLMNTPSALLYPFANESVHNSNANEKFSESPCPTPAYHLSVGLIKLNIPFILPFFPSVGSTKTNHPRRIEFKCRNCGCNRPTAASGHFIGRIWNGNDGSGYSASGFSNHAKWREQH